MNTNTNSGNKISAYFDLAANVAATWIMGSEWSRKCDLSNGIDALYNKECAAKKEYKKIGIKDGSAVSAIDASNSIRNAEVKTAEMEALKEHFGRIAARRDKVIKLIAKINNAQDPASIKLTQDLRTYTDEINQVFAEAGVPEKDRSSLWRAIFGEKKESATAPAVATAAA